MNIKYSILIPTMNGGKYLIHAINSVLQNPNNNFELVISINHSSDGTEEALKNIDDKRIRFIRPKEKLSMAAHYEWCIENARGEWITILGDDDGIMPDFFSYCDYLINKWGDVKVFSFKRAYFFWPESEDVFGDTILHYVANLGEKIRLCKFDLFLVLAGLREHYDLPQLYTNNLVKKSLIDSIKKKSHGKFYHEVTPDVYSGVAISLSIYRYLKVGKPLFWTGSSPKSMGVAIAKGNEETDENSSEHFDLAKKDGLNIASQINPFLYKKSDFALNIYVLSSLFNIPFKYNFINKKLLEYLVYGSAFAKNILPSSLKLDSSSLFKQYYYKHIKSRKLNFFILIILFLISFFLISLKQVYSYIKKYILIISNKENKKLMYIKKRNGLNTISDANNFLKSNL
tara:strand:+ start:864 stop:2063 length:1200 start_codon:yes stop_codon:yes gene_type:complete